MAWGHATRRRLLGTVAVTGAVGVGGAAGVGRAAGQGSDDYRHLLVFGGSPAEPVRYAFSADGEIEKAESAGPAPVEDHRVSADSDDLVSDDATAATGGVAGGADAFRFTGDLRWFGVEVTAETVDRVQVYLDGDRVHPAALTGAASSPITFLDCARARIPGDLGDGEISISTMGPVGIDTHIFGLPDEGGVYRPDVDAPAVALDSVSYGDRGDDWRSVGNPYAGPWCLDYHLVVAGGSPETPVHYEFETRQSARKTDDVGDVPVSRATVDGDDVIESGDGRGASVRGGVAGGADAYYLRGELVRFSLDGDAAVYVGGERVEPADLGSRGA